MESRCRFPLGNSNFSRHFMEHPIVDSPPATSSARRWAYEDGAFTDCRRHRQPSTETGEVSKRPELILKVGRPGWATKALEDACSNRAGLAVKRKRCLVSAARHWLEQPHRFRGALRCTKEARTPGGVWQLRKSLS